MIVGLAVWSVLFQEHSTCCIGCGLWCFCDPCLSFEDILKVFLPLDEAITSRLVIIIISGSDRRKRFWSKLNNWKTARDRPRVNVELIGTPLSGCWMGYLRPHHPANPNIQTVGDGGLCQYSIFENTLAGCEVLPWTIVQLLPKTQMSERRMSTVWVVIKRPDHHCCGHLVFYLELSFRPEPGHGRHE